MNTSVLLHFEHKFNVTIMESWLQNTLLLQKTKWLVWLPVNYCLRHVGPYCDVFIWYIIKHLLHEYSRYSWKQCEGEFFCAVWGFQWGQNCEIIMFYYILNINVMSQSLIKLHITIRQRLVALYKSLTIIMMSWNVTRLVNCIMIWCSLFRDLSYVT